MTAIANARLTERGPLVPALGTIPSAANQQFHKGTLVSRDASGNAVPPTDGDGLNVAGVSQAYYDNRTGSEAGGSAGDLDVQVDYGVFALDISGATPVSGQVMYAVDNQTVSADSAGGTRGIAGICTEVGTVNGVSQAFTFVGPLAIAAALASLDIVTIALNAFRVDDGTAVPAFSNGVADGFQLTDSEALSIRFNDAVGDVLAVTIPLVKVDGQDIVLHAQGFRVGAADADAALTVAAFFHSVGEAHTADADAGGTTTAFDGATTIITEETLTLAAADVPPGPCSLTLTITPANLDSDDLCLLGLWLTGAKAA